MDSNDKENLSLQHMVELGNDRDLPIEEFERVFIKECLKYENTLKQGLRFYFSAYLKIPPKEYVNKGSISEKDFFNQILIPRFQNEWIRLDKERKADWVLCENCHELLPRAAFNENILSTPICKNECIRCYNTGPRKFGQPKRRK